MADQNGLEFIGAVKEMDAPKAISAEDNRYKLGLNIQGFGWMGLFGSQVEIEDAQKEIAAGAILKGVYTLSGKYKNIEKYTIEKKAAPPPGGKLSTGPGHDQQAAGPRFPDVKEFMSQAGDAAAAMAGCYADISMLTKDCETRPTSEDLRAMAISSVIEAGNRYESRRR